jgi:two-component system KDP operon response regulator KdpE
MTAGGCTGAGRGAARVLVVEDDQQVRNFIEFVLEREGYRCARAGAAREAIAMLGAVRPDLILLDLGLPDLDGMEVIRAARARGGEPIIVISARDQDQDKVAALDGGADDYLTKPFSASELLARIRVALRHSSFGAGPAGAPAPQAAAAAPTSSPAPAPHATQGLPAARGLPAPQAAPPQPPAEVGGLSVDFERRLVAVSGAPVHLTPMEYDLLSMLARSPGKVLTTSAIIREVWGAGYGPDTQALRTLMAGLRRKVEQNPAKPRYILTEVGVGYRLASE